MWSLINKATPIIIIIIHYSTCIDFEMSLQALGSRQVHYFGSGNFMFYFRMLSKKIDYGNNQIHIKKTFSLSMKRFVCFVVNHISVLCCQ